ncbi:TIR domain-containing protein [Leifsonia sp. NPDC102414]|uniref:TIR domain-containing protein n=1 Tax=Leifsonia sp. NPDC102414 TaxID=3364124 RepID=UPI0038087EAF
MNRAPGDYDFDVAVTFAGEDREIVAATVEIVKSAGYSVFYDEDSQADLWGEDLTEYFPDIYERRSRFAVMFISADYAAKPWTRLERRSVLIRAMEQPTPYLLPVRIDQTELPGVRASISYLDANVVGASGIAEAIARKLGSQKTEGTGRFNGLVPRTEQEAATLVGERPPGWEHLLFSFALVEEFKALEPRFLDYQIGYASNSHFVVDSELINFVSEQNAVMKGNIRNFMTVLSPATQLRAFGAPGEPGDVDTIFHLAKRVGSVFSGFLGWGIGLRGTATESDEGDNLTRALASFSDQPVQLLHDFPMRLRAETDQLSAAIASDTPFTITMELALEITDESNRRFDVALTAFRKARQ